MKKLLVLMLVLGLASVANAITLKISVDGIVDPPDSEINVCPSGHLDLDIWCGGFTGAGGVDNTFWALVVDTASGTITGGVVISPPAPTLTTVDGQSAVEVFYPGLNPGEDGPWGGIAGGPTEVTPAGVYVDEFEFHCIAPGDAIIRLVGSTDFENWVVLDTQVIHQVPEPASMLLLGLGGLLLRRRK